MSDSTEFNAMKSTLASSRNAVNKLLDALQELAEELKNLQQERRRYKLTAEQVEKISELRAASQRLGKAFDKDSAEKFCNEAKEALKKSDIGILKQKKINRLINKISHGAKSIDRAETFLTDFEKLEKDPSLSAEDLLVVSVLKQQYVDFLNKCVDENKDFELFETVINNDFAVSSEIAERIQDDAIKEGRIVSCLVGYDKKNISLIHSYDEETAEWAKGKCLEYTRKHDLSCFNRDDFYTMAKWMNENCVLYDELSEETASRIEEECSAMGVAIHAEYDKKYVRASNGSLEEKGFASIVVLESDKEKFERIKTAAIPSLGGYSEWRSKGQSSKHKETQAALKFVQNDKKGKSAYVFDTTKKEPAHYLVLNEEGVFEMVSGENKPRVSIYRESGREKGRPDGKVDSQFEKRAQTLIENFSGRPAFIEEENAAAFGFVQGTHAVPDELQKNLVRRFSGKFPKKDAYLLSAAESKLASFLSTEKEFTTMEAAFSGKDFPKDAILRYKDAKTERLKETAAKLKKAGVPEEEIKNRVMRDNETLQSEVSLLLSHQTELKKHFDGFCTVSHATVISHEEIEKMDLSTGDEDLDESLRKAVLNYFAVMKPEEYEAYKNERAAAQKEAMQSTKTQQKEYASPQDRKKEKEAYYTKELEERTEAAVQKENARYEDRMKRGKPAKRRSETEIRNAIITDIGVEDVMDFLKEKASGNRDVLGVLADTEAIADAVSKDPAYHASMLQGEYNEELDSMIRDKMLEIQKSKTQEH